MEILTILDKNELKLKVQELKFMFQKELNSNMNKS